VLYRALGLALARFEAGERDGEALRRIVRVTLAAEPLANPEYVSVADRETLREVERIGEGGALLSLAVRIGRTRLIDNLVLGS
jgi:pantoate--beta-alanine ligase